MRSKGALAYTLTLDQHSSEPRGPVIQEFSPINTVNVFPLAYDFLNSIFFAYFMVRLQCKIHGTYQITCKKTPYVISLWSTVVKCLGNKSYSDVQLCWGGVGAPAPCCPGTHSACSAPTFHPEGWLLPTVPCRSREVPRGRAKGLRPALAYPQGFPGEMRRTGRPKADVSLASGGHRVGFSGARRRHLLAMSSRAFRLWGRVPPHPFVYPSFLSSVRLD